MKHMSQSVQASTTGSEVLRLHFVEFARRALVDQVEEAGEAVAEIETAAAAMTDVEDAAQLGIEFFEIVEIGIVPVERMARGASVLPSSGCSSTVSDIECEQQRWREAAWRYAISRHPRSRLAARGCREPSGSGGMALSALPSVSNQSAISSKPSSRAVRAMPGYMSVYSCVSPAMAAFRFWSVAPMGSAPSPDRPLPRGIRRWPCAWPVFAFGGGAEDGGDIVVAFDVGLLREIEIAAIGLAFAGKRLLEVFHGLRTGKQWHVLVLLTRYAMDRTNMPAWQPALSRPVGE